MKTATRWLLSLFITGIGIVGADALPAPIDLEATDGTYSDMVRVSWSVSTDNYENATSYQIWRCPDNTFPPLQIGTSTATNYDDTTATPGIIYRYLARLEYGTNSCETATSRSDTGFCGSPNPVIGPVIKANGHIDDYLTINSSNNLSITVQLDPGEYAGTKADWWVCAFGIYDGSLYYLDGVAGWTQESNLDNWHPAYQGSLFNLPAYEVLNIAGLGAGWYNFIFAVDTPMDGALSYGNLWCDSVYVIVIVQ